MTEPIDLPDLEGRIDGFLLRRMRSGDGPFKLTQQVPRPTWNRFDLGFKLLWLDAQQGHVSDFAEGIYERHVAAFSLNDMAEPGNEAKRGIARFRTDFANLLTDMRTHGFDATKSLVPLASDGSLLNAGHRAATAMALNISVAAVETGLDPVNFDHRFFAKRGMGEGDLDAAAIRMVEAMPNAAIALLWPAARGRDRETDNLIGPLVYRRAVRLSLNAGQLLLSRVYRGEPWLGPEAENFPGIRRKLMGTFNGKDPLRVLIFDAPPGRDRMQLKEKVRALYGIGKHAIHITDTHEEAVELAHLLLSPSARHFLEYGKPTAFAETRRNLELLSKAKRENPTFGRDMAIDTGMVVGLYGLRAPSDIDVVAAAPLPFEDIETHDAKGHSAPLGDLLQDPALHFRYRGFRWISLAEVAALKRTRLAGQDREDLLRIAPLLIADPMQAKPNPASLRMRFAILRLRRAAIRTLMALGIGHPLKRLYRRFKR